MGIGKFFKGLFAPAAVTIDYSGQEDTELLELSAARTELTDAARAALDQELQRRGLDLSPDSPAREEESVVSELGPEAAELLPGAEVTPHTLYRALGRDGLLLWTSGSSHVLLLFPTEGAAGALPAEDPNPGGQLEDDEDVTGLLLIDPAGVGRLDTVGALTRHDVPRTAVWALSARYSADRPDPAERAPERLLAKELPARADFNRLTLERLEGAPHILRATWYEEQTSMLIGQRIPPGMLFDLPGVTHVAGGFAPRAEDTAKDWDLFLAAMGGSGLSDLLLFGEAVGVTAEPALSLMPGHGVRVQEIGRTLGERPIRERLAAAMAEGDEDAIRAFIGASEALLVEPLLEALALEGAHSELRGLAQTAMAVSPDDGTYAYWAGVAEGLAGRRQEAVLHYRRALAAAKVEQRAHLALAADALWPHPAGWGEARPSEADLDESAGHIATFRAVRPKDPVSAHLAAVLAFARGAEGARPAMDNHELADALAPHVADVLAELLEEPRGSWEDVTARCPALSPRQWSLLARRALLLARSLLRDDRREDAERLLRRAMALDPLLESAVVELAALLAPLGRGEEAVGVVDELLARFPTAAYARLARAETLLRLALEQEDGGVDRLTEAVEEYRNCADLEPSWRNVRMGLLSALMMLGRFEEAEAELRVLAEMGAPELLLESIARQIRAARGLGGAAPDLVRNRRGRLGI